MRVIITGVSGLIGTAIAKKLLINGYYVVGIRNSRSSEIVHNNYKEIISDLTIGDLNIDGSFDCLIHCAAIIPQNGIPPEKLEELNQKIDNTIVSFVKKNKIKLVYFSTAFIYAGNQKMLTEDAGITSDLHGYYLSKVNTEKNISATIENYVIFRISSPYGDLNKQHNVMRLFADNCKKDITLRLIDEGKREQNFIHTEDISEACLLAIKLNINGLYNLTFNLNYTMYQLAKSIKSLLNSKSEILFDNSRKDNQPNVNFSNSKICSAINWEPQIDLESGLKKTLKN